ncbi:uncharacterized protein LOC136093436 [Hydra vulgaris]|uniref:uncharacterized protein LOC136093436 n=1 Tax=Hydra vulgaris TaxID=6087 RepID=UPI0032EA6965
MSSKLNTEVSIKLVREIFQEMFQKQQKDILALLSANLKLANDRIDGLLKEINTLKNSCEVLKKENENRNTDLKKTNKQMIKRNNLRIEGVKENDNENWDDTEVKIINLLENNLNVKDVIIERAHRTGIIDNKKPRTIVIKLLNYKDKVKILKNSNKLKGSGIYINEDFSLETTIIRKKLLEESKTHRINGNGNFLAGIEIIRRINDEDVRHNQQEGFRMSGHFLSPSSQSELEVVVVSSKMQLSKKSRMVSTSKS